MFASSHSTRLPKAVALLAVVVATMTPTAQSAEIPDAVDRWLNNHSATTDTNGAAIVPDFVDRYVASHGGAGAGDLGSPDTRDIAAGYVPAHVQQDEFNPGVTDFPARPADPALAPPRILQVVRIPAADGFDWADAGVGAGITAALMLLLLSTRQLAVHRRRHDASSAYSS